MKANKALIFALVAAAGCSGVSQPGGGGGGGGGDDGSGSGMGSGSGSNMPPPVNVLAGTMFDERNDAIDFSSGQPVHTHAGASIDLSSGQTACPDVYKYAYLMDQGGAPFGKEATPNPFAWSMRTDIASIDPNATAYRVRNKAGSVLLDWTSVWPNAEGIYHIELHRNGEHPIAQLGTSVDELHLEMRFRTTEGTETDVSTCWNNHPMAAPLDISAARTGQLFGLSLPAKPALAPLMTISAGIGAIEMPIVQQTAEPVAITLHVPYPTGTVSTTAADVHVVASVTAVDFSCDYAADPVGCKTHAYTPVYPTMSQALTGAWTVAIVDDVSHQNLCASDATALDLACIIPARQANEAPHPYRAVLTIFGQPLVEFRPDDYNSVGDYSVGDSTAPGVTQYSGLAPQTDNLTFCSKVLPKVIHGVIYTSCLQHTSYARIVAVDKATIQLDAVPFTLTTGAAATAAQPSYVTNAMLTFPASTWNAGDAGF